MIQQSNGNNEWKKGYREGFADGYAQAKKEQVFNPYGPGTVLGSPPVTWGTDKNPRSILDGPSTCATGMAYASNPAAFVTGMSVSSSDC